MLSKEICIRCHDVHGMSFIEMWSAVDEDYWRGTVRDGVTMVPSVVCPRFRPRLHFATRKCAAVADEPPEWCPYAVEHVLSEDQ